MIKNNSFRETKRYQVAMINYPPFVAAIGLTLIVRMPKAISDISSLRGIPPQSTCKQMINLSKGGNYSAVSYRAGTFTEQSARIIILNVHKLCNTRSRVKDKEQWIKTRISLPNQSYFYSDDDMAKYATLIFGLSRQEEHTGSQPLNPHVRLSHHASKGLHQPCNFKWGN